jgi:Tol biopolymer transport system component
VIYVSNGVAMSAPFDPEQLSVTGPPTPLTEDVRQSLAPPANLWQFAVSAEGSLVFIPGGRANQRSLMWVDRHGVGTPVGADMRAYQQVRLSPDGQRLALTIREPAAADVWIYELAHDRLTRLTSGGDNTFPVWSPDGTRIAFASGRFGPHNMFVQAADGGSPIERLLTSDKVQRPRSWSPDGRMLSFTQDDPMPDLWNLSLEQPPMPRPIVQLPGYQTSSRISPDGRWLAYASEESGQFETYVTGFPNGVGKSKVSSGGGVQPVWARNGRELFYLKDDKLMVVEVNARSTFAAGKPAQLFQRQSFIGPAGEASYDVSLDGQRFVMIQTSAEHVTASQVNVVLGWADELTRRERAGQH